MGDNSIFIVGPLGRCSTCFHVGSANEESIMSSKVDDIEFLYSYESVDMCSECAAAIAGHKINEFLSGRIPFTNYKTGEKLYHAMGLKKREKDVINSAMENY